MLSLEGSYLLKSDFKGRQDMKVILSNNILYIIRITYSQLKSDHS